MEFMSCTEDNQEVGLDGGTDWGTDRQMSYINPCSLT